MTQEEYKSAIEKLPDGRRIVVRLRTGMPDAEANYEGRYRKVNYPSLVLTFDDPQGRTLYATYRRILSITEV